MGIEVANLSRKKTAHSTANFHHPRSANVDEGRSTDAITKGESKLGAKRKSLGCHSGAMKVGCILKVQFWCINNLDAKGKLLGCKNAQLGCNCTRNAPAPALAPAPSVLRVLWPPLT